MKIKNFKTFSDVHKIGPITQLTAIIGPNGSGKSNFIDALAFALYLPLMPSKHKHTRELVTIKKMKSNAEEDQK